jgi:hypothetical protein
MHPGLRRVVVLAAAVASAAACNRGGASQDGRGALAVSPPSADVELAATQSFVTAPAVAVTWEVTRVPFAAPTAFPVRFSANGRYLEDQAGRPWRIQADAAWTMSAKATSAQVDTYLADRKAKGFNAFYLMAMVHPGGYASVPNAPANAAGALPFAGAPFLSPSEPYWAFIDTIVDKAAAQGIAVMLAYDYLGWQGGSMGWATEVGALTEAQATAWGTWLGNRYASRSNVIWFAAGDYRPPSGSPLERNVVATIRAIKAAGANQVFMAELNEYDDIPSLEGAYITTTADGPGPGRAMTNSFYGYGPTCHYEVYATAASAYTASPTRPAFMQEGTYEGPNEDNCHIGLVDEVWSARRGRLWSVLGGATAGDGFGSNLVWSWQSFPASLQSPGSVQSSYAFALFAQLPWWDLLPSGAAAGRVLVPSGGGSCASAPFDCVTAAVTVDRSWLLAYYPGSDGGTAAATFSVDLGALSGPSRARWWNPRTGAWTAIATGLAVSGTRSFTTPGSNGGGNDWLLVLDAGANPCGSISASGLYQAPGALPAGSDCGVRAISVTDPNVAGTAHVTVIP